MIPTPIGLLLFNDPVTLFTIVCDDTRRRFDRGRLSKSDYDFIDEMPETAMYYGFSHAFGLSVQREFRDMLKRRPKRVPRNRQPYFYDPRVGELHSAGMSVRGIANRLDLSKAAAERCLREYRRLPKQELFPFIHDYPGTTKRSPAGL